MEDLKRCLGSKGLCLDTIVSPCILMIDNVPSVSINMTEGTSMYMVYI